MGKIEAEIWSNTFFDEKWEKIMIHIHEKQYIR
jgi:hypothetical protein